MGGCHPLITGGMASVKLQLYPIAFFLVNSPAFAFACVVYLQCAIGFHMATNSILPNSKIEGHKILVSVVWPAALMSAVAENQLVEKARRCMDLPGFCRDTPGLR